MDPGCRDDGLEPPPLEDSGGGGGWTVDPPLVTDVTLLLLRFIFMCSEQNSYLQIRFQNISFLMLFQNGIQSTKDRWSQQKIILFQLCQSWCNSSPPSDTGWRGPGTCARAAWGRHLDPGSCRWSRRTWPKDCPHCVKTSVRQRDSTVWSSLQRIW